MVAWSMSVEGAGAVMQALRLQRLPTESGWPRMEWTWTRFVSSRWASPILNRCRDLVYCSSRRTQLVEKSAQSAMLSGHRPFDVCRRADLLQHGRPRHHRWHASSQRGRSGTLRRRCIRCSVPSTGFSKTSAPSFATCVSTPVGPRVRPHRRPARCFLHQCSTCCSTGRSQVAIGIVRRDLGPRRIRKQGSCTGGVSDCNVRSAADLLRDNQPENSISSEAFEQHRLGSCSRLSLSRGGGVFHVIFVMARSYFEEKIAERKQALAAGGEFAAASGDPADPQLYEPALLSQLVLLLGTPVAQHLR
eukprot:s2423_g12.t5